MSPSLGISSSTKYFLDDLRCWDYFAQCLKGSYKTRMLTEVGRSGVHGFSLSGTPSCFSEGFDLQSLTVGFFFLGFGLLCKILAPPCGFLGFSGNFTLCSYLASTDL